MRLKFIEYIINAAWRECRYDARAAPGTLYTLLMIYSDSPFESSPWKNPIKIVNRSQKLMWESPLFKLFGFNIACVHCASITWILGCRYKYGDNYFILYCYKFKKIFLLCEYVIIILVNNVIFRNFVLREVF